MMYHQNFNIVDEFTKYLKDTHDELLHELCTSERPINAYEVAIKRVVLNKIETKWQEMKGAQGYAKNIHD